MQGDVHDQARSDEVWRQYADPSVRMRTIAERHGITRQRVDQLVRNEARRRGVPVPRRRPRKKGLDKRANAVAT